MCNGKCDEEGKSEKKLELNHSDEDYVRLEINPCNVSVQSVRGEFVSPKPKYWELNWWWWWWWGKLIVSAVLLVVLVLVLFKWVVPVLMNKEVIPILDWEMRTFKTPVLAVVIFASVAFPPLIFLPSTPSMWLAAMTFGYWIGFLLVMAGVSVAVSLSYFIGSLFYNKIQRWLQKYPEKALIIKLAGEGNWVHQFQAITLIRITPFPYVIFNYAAVATDVKYSPYLLGSLVGMVPEVLVALYSGMLIGTLADARQDKESLSMLQNILNVVGFGATLGAAVIIGVYAKRKLNDRLQENEKEEPFLSGIDS